MRPPGTTRAQLRRRTVAFASVALLAPLGIAAPAHADGLADAPTAFSGTVYLPGGQTVAKAAVIDLSLAGADAFARTVSGIDGRFSLDLPETDTLVTAALVNGSRLAVRWTASDLHPQTDVPPVSSQAVLGTVHTSPGFSQLTGEFVAYLIDSTTGAIADALSDPTMVEFRLPDTAAGGLVTLATDLAAAHGVFNDPDMIAGYEDLDDPDLVPPLGAMLSTFEPVLDAAALGGSASEPTDPTERGPVAEAIEATPDGLGLRHPDEGGGNPPTCSKDRGTYWWRNDLDNTPTGTTTYVYLDTYSCDFDNDEDRDEVVYKWDGYTGAVDKNWRIWRLKFRSEANKNSGYLRKDARPTGNVEAGNTTTVNWNVGFSYVAEATVGGTYHFKAKKIHPWYWDENGKLYHVSWISNSKYGSPGGGFNNGGGFRWDLPARANGRSAVYNKIDVWRCVGHSCDGNR